MTGKSGETANQHRHSHQLRYRLLAALTILTLSILALSSPALAANITETDNVAVTDPTDVAYLEDTPASCSPDGVVYVPRAHSSGDNLELYYPNMTQIKSVELSNMDTISIFRLEDDNASTAHAAGNHSNEIAYAKVDVSDPCNPSVDVSGSDDEVSGAAVDMALTDSHAYLTSTSNANIVQIDQSTGSNKSKDGNTHHFNKLDALVAANGYLYGSRPSTDSLEIWDPNGSTYPIDGDLLSIVGLSTAPGQFVQVKDDLAFIEDTVVKDADDPTNASVDRTWSQPIQTAGFYADNRGLPLTGSLFVANNDDLEKYSPYGSSMSREWNEGTTDRIHAVDTDDDHIYAVSYEDNSLYKIDFGNILSGTVRKCNVIENQGDCADITGNPVEDARVKVVAANASHPDIDDAEQHISDLSAEKPGDWDSNFDANQELDSDTAVIHTGTADEYGTTGEWDDVEIGEESTVDFAADDVVHLSVLTTDTSGLSGRIGFSGFDTKEGVDITITGIAPRSDNVTEETYTVPTRDGIREGVFDVGYDTHADYVRTGLTCGYYRAESDAADLDTVFRVGSGCIADNMEKEFENAKGELTSYSDELESQANNQKLQFNTETTDSDGDYKIHLPLDFQGSATVTAYKLEHDVSSLKSITDNLKSSSMSDVRENTTDLDAEEATNFSFYLPHQPKTIDIPEDSPHDIQLKSVEAGVPGMNQSDYEDLLNESLKNLFDEPLDDIWGRLQDTDQLDSDELEQRRDDLADMADNTEVGEDYGDIYEGDDDLTDDDLSDSELRDQIQALSTSIEQLNSQLDGSTTTTTSGDSTIEGIYTADGTIESKDDVAVYVHRSDGVTESVADENISIDSGIRSDTVTATYSLPSDVSSASFEFNVLGAENDELGKAVSSSITNPAVSQSPAKISSIAVSSWEPSTGDSVEMQVNAPSDSRYSKVVSAETWGPNGSTIDTAASGDTVSYTASDNVGAHVTHVTYQDSEGRNYTETVKVSASEASETRAGIAYRQGATQNYALVSGFSDATVKEGSEGPEVTAQLSQDAEVPKRIHLYNMEGSGAEYTGSVEVVRGEDESSVSKHIQTVWHVEDLSSDSVRYRVASEDDRQPLYSGSPYGDYREASSTGDTLLTYTESDGGVEVFVDNDPGRVRSAFWSYHKTVAEWGF